MKKLRMVVLMASVLLFAIAIVFILTKPTPDARPMRLVIIAPEGQRFSGTYVADGITNAVTAVAPATISLRAKDLSFEFTHDKTNADFRVEMFVGDLCRTSTTGEKKQGIRGALLYAPNRESYWAAAF